MIELTAEPSAAMEQQKSPLQFVDLHTNEVYVLIRKNVYDLTCQIVGGPRKAWARDSCNSLSGSTSSSTRLRPAKSRNQIIYCRECRHLQLIRMRDEEACPTCGADSIAQS